MAGPRKKISDYKHKAKRREQKKLTLRKLSEKMKNNPSALEEDRKKARERYYKEGKRIS